LGRANHICDKHRLHGPHSLHHQEKQNPNFFHKQNQEKKAQNSKNNFHKKDLERKPIKISIPNQEPETQQRKDPRFIYIHKRKKKKNTLIQMIQEESNKTWCVKLALILVIHLLGMM
jgi:hypothetical protein